MLVVVRRVRPKHDRRRSQGSERNTQKNEKGADRRRSGVRHAARHAKKGAQKTQGEGDGGPQTGPGAADADQAGDGLFQGRFGHLPGQASEFLNPRFAGLADYVAQEANALGEEGQFFVSDAVVA